MSRKDPIAVSPWAAYEPDADAPWNLRRVVHLHRRAGFAAPWEVLQRDLADGPDAAIERLLNPPADEAFEAMADVIGDAATASGSRGRLKAWWMYRMLFSPDPLGERLTLMWHNHFATSNRKVQDLVLMREQNELLRKYARGPFGELLRAVVKHPAMLVWLDADSNRRGAPNENLARELMELFTLGIGNYTEDDVKAAARALTGWTVAEGRLRFREARHDDGEKTLLGQTGRFNGDDVLDILLAKCATAERLAWRLRCTFLADDANELSRSPCTAPLDVSCALEILLRSRWFFSDANLAARIAGPIDYIVGTLRALELCDPPPSTLLLAEWAARMGRDLFYPPNVGGWNEGRPGLGSRYVVARANFARAVVTGELWHPARPPDFAALLKRHDVSRDLHEAAVWLAKLLWGDAPEDVIKDIVAGATSIADVVLQLLQRPEHHLV